MDCDDDDHVSQDAAAAAAGVASLGFRVPNFFLARSLDFKLYLCDCAQSMIWINVQSDPSGCSLGVVDIKMKVAF